MILTRPDVNRHDFHYMVQIMINEAKKRDSTKELMRKLALENLFFLAVYILDMTYLDNDFAYALCNEVQVQKYGRLWVIAREHFKSTIITVASTIQELLRNPEERMCIYSYKADAAQIFLGQIKTEFEQNPKLKEYFDDIVWEEPTKGYERDEEGNRIPIAWTTTGITLKRKSRSKECSLECSSILSQKTGYHFTKLIYDDVMTPESVKTKESIELVRTAWQMSLNTGVAQDLQYCIIGTYYHYAELYAWIAKNQVAQLIKQSAVEDDGTTPVLLTPVALAKKKRAMGSAVFASQMLCDPLQASTQNFKQEWVRRWSCQIMEGLNIYIIVDPAGKEGRKRDYCVFWVIGLDAADNFYIIDIFRDKMNLTRRTRTLFQLHRTYKPKATFYEQVGMQSDVEHIQGEMERINYRFSIITFGQWVEKGLRIESLIPILEAQRFYFPEKCVHRNWEGVDEDMLGSFFLDEYDTYPFCAHDDGLDSLSDLNHPEVVAHLSRPDMMSREEAIYEKLKGKGLADLPFHERDEYRPY